MNKRVMIIEDNVTTLRTLSNMVRTILPDADIREFFNLDGAYETAMNSTMDLFLVDIILDRKSSGDMSGIRFVDRIRNVAQYEFTPVIFITSLEDPKCYAYSQLHSYGYIEKPFDEKKLAELIEKALHFPKGKARESVLYFRKDGIIFPVKVSEILYIESYNHKVFVHKTSGEVMVVPYRSCHRILEEADSDRLIQCSRSTIFNRDYVQNIDFVNRYICMTGLEKPLEIGVTYYKKIGREFRYDLSN